MSRLRRKLTPFICQEMLYEYAIGRLDEERRAAVEELLETHQETREMLDGVKAAINFTDKMMKIQISPSVLEQLRESENLASLSRRYSSWKSWPESLRWSVTAIAISSVVALTVAMIPWHRLPGFKKEKPSEFIEIAKIPASNSQLVAVEEQAEPETMEVAETNEGSGDEHDDHGHSVADAPPTEAKPLPPSTPYIPPAVVAKNEKSEPSGPPLAVSVIEPDPPEPKQTPAASADLEAGGEDSKNARKEAAPKSFVYRAFMALPNLEEMGPKVASIIQEFGGEKAGEVELGWVRGSGRYYHFSLPAENEARLLDVLKAYGPVRISKDPHSRVMPPGQVRFILWVEAAN